MSPGGDERRIRASVHRRLAEEALDLDVADPRSLLEPRLVELVRDEAPLLPEPRVGAVVDDLLADVLGFGPLEPLLAEPEVTEIMLNGPGEAWVERAGRIERVPLDLSAADLAHLVERAVLPLGLRFDRASPVVDARLPDGSRLHAVGPPLAVDGPYVTVRRFAARRLPLAAFDVGPDVEGLLARAVRGGWNLLVSGGTASGKTTLLNALAALVPPGDRVVTIEETAELRLERPHVVRLEARPANAEGAGAVTARDLLRAALRMRPDRIVVGEVRGPEALDMVDALNTGHDGSLSTIHANGPTEALLRLEALALRGAANLPLAALRAQIASSVDAVVHLARSEGSRVLAEVGEVHDGPSGPEVRRLYARRDGLLARPARALRRAPVTA